MARYKAIRVTEATQQALIELADARGISIDSLLQRYFLPRFTKWGKFKVGHCKYCHKPLVFSWEELDEAIDRHGWYHTDCWKKYEKTKE